MGKFSETVNVTTATDGYVAAEVHRVYDDGIEYRSVLHFQTADAVALADAIERGRAGTTMRGYAEDLTEQSVADLIALIRSWQSDVPPPSAVKLEQDLAQAAEAILRRHGLLAAAAEEECA